MLFSEKRRFKGLVGWGQIGPIFLINPMVLCNAVFWLVVLFTGVSSGG
jgi:hypothetical protein